MRQHPPAKLGEDVTETLEIIPSSWKVTQTARETFSCRDCQITHLPAPFHVLPRGWAAPSFLAMLLFEKGLHRMATTQKIGEMHFNLRAATKVDMQCCGCARCQASAP